MKEARIILPTVANGNVRSSANVHQLLAVDLAYRFGGYTAIKGSGGWLDREAGMLVTEEVTIYDVAVASHDARAAADLSDLALRAGRQLDQKAVYVRLPNGEVRIIDL